MKQSMDLNKETASRLWVKQFGKKQKAVDFSGRTIARAAYNDRNSEYGWNVDHILPESRGGKTADHNLICCHILTNDEKADKFPCFKANGKEFEIQNRQNHYEIIVRSDEEDDPQEEAINFLDAAQGLECWKQCRADGKDVFVGYVKIKVETENESDQLLERYRNFLSELFDTDLIFVEQQQSGFYTLSGYAKRSFVYTVIIDSIPTKEDTQNLLDNCVILNTYSLYFTNKTGFDNIQIVCGMEQYDSRFEATLKCKNSILEKRVYFSEDLSVDELVKINTSAEKELKDTYPQNGFYCYDRVYTQLEKDLEKRI
ncbi:MAG: HNH endonuclease signature motif containing protein [Clostridia bacterium]|nr:HNH endonuclease signature motif containing protein [Clostridia bacterium]